MSPVTATQGLLESFGRLAIPLRDIPENLPAAVTSGKREEIYPSGLAKHLYDLSTPVEQLKDRSEIRCIGRIYKYQGEEFSGEYLAIERTSDKAVFLLSDTEFESLRTPGNREASERIIQDAANLANLNFRR